MAAVCAINLLFCIIDRFIMIILQLFVTIKQAVA